jgi:hypothetical protein
MQSTSTDVWSFKGEGNANIVFAYTGTDATLVSVNSCKSISKLRLPGAWLTMDSSADRDCSVLACAASLWPHPAEGAYHRGTNAHARCLTTRRRRARSCACARPGPRTLLPSPTQWQSWRPGWAGHAVLTNGPL